MSRQPFARGLLAQITYAAISATALWSCCKSKNSTHLYTGVKPVRPFGFPFKGANVLKRRSTQIATGNYFQSLNESEKAHFVQAMCDLSPDETIEDLEARLWGSLRLQIKPEKTSVDLVVTPILSFIMLVMMYLPTDGHNISGAELSAPDVSVYTTLVALFRLPGLFSLALFFFLMSAVEQRIPRRLHLTGLASLITGF